MAQYNPNGTPREIDGRPMLNTVQSIAEDVVGTPSSLAAGHASGFAAMGAANFATPYTPTSSTQVAPRAASGTRTAMQRAQGSAVPMRKNRRTIV